MRAHWLSVSLLLLSACDSTPDDKPSDDPEALHRIQRVKVAQDIELEVLDFGGQGPALVFLAGMGSTGHVFDVLAPEFVATHHVYAITRRGYGASSWPDTGYDSPTLGRDILAVLDGLGLTKATLAGHSLAGDEMGWLGGAHPERIEAFIYLDATDARGQIAHFLEGSPLPPLPFSTLDGLPSREAVASVLERDLGGRLPEHELEQAYEFDATSGAYLRARRHPQAMELSVRGCVSPDFAASTSPALSLPDGQDMSGWLEAVSLNEALPDDFRETARTYLPELRQYEANQDALLHGLPNWTLVSFNGAGHYIWLTRHAEVVQAMRTFLARP